MKFGAVFPQYEISDKPADLKRFITELEGMGYDYVIFYDHVLGANPEREREWRGPYTYQTQFHEPLTTFAWMAALTETIEFTTSILILPQRQTALVAKQAAQVDLLSGGRLRLGVAVGWNWVEYEALGEDFHTRGKRANQQIPLLRELWTNELVTFEGDFDQIPDAGINPMPVQQPIPIWIGGTSDAAMRRAAALGDGWMPNPIPDLEKRAAVVAKLHRFLEEADRDPADFGLDVRASLRYYDTPEQWRDYIGDWTERGATHISFNTMHVGIESLDTHLDWLRQFIQVAKGTPSKTTSA